MSFFQTFAGLEEKMRQVAAASIEREVRERLIKEAEARAEVKV